MELCRLRPPQQLRPGPLRPESLDRLHGGDVLDKVGGELGGVFHGLAGAALRCLLFIAISGRPALVSGNPADAGRVVTFVNSN